MQMICHHLITDFDTWKAAFDADDEARRDAGLSVLQVWRDKHDGSHAFFLLNVNDRARAEAWIKRSDALTSDDNSTVTRATAFFIETA